MKRNLLLASLLVVIGAAVAAALILKQRPAAKETEATPEEGASRLTHDETGRVVLKMDQATQERLGLAVARPTAAEFNTSVKGYGRVLDPAPLIALMTDLASARAAALASGQEFSRLKLLASQGNASTSKLQSAEAVAQRDRLAVQATEDRLLATWGKAIANQTNLAAFVRPLAAQESALVRIDLPAGEPMPEEPARARITTLSGGSTEAEYLDATSTVDPEALGWGALFLVNPNRLSLKPGAPVAGYLELPGKPAVGVIVPREAVVRAEGRGWVYVQRDGGKSYVRTEVPLVNPAAAGWFVSRGLSTNDELVVTGAQSLLSEELKAAIKSD